jgi:hypothetical protein
MKRKSDKAVSRAKNAKDAKIVFNKKRVMGGAFASLARLARSDFLNSFGETNPR